MDHAPWQQINISYPGHTAQEREQQAVAHLSRVLPAAKTAGLITCWWFIRKGAWRIRYLPTNSPDSQDQAHRLLTEGVPWTRDIYEPETHAFGGHDAMTTAHMLFHHDSRHLLTYLYRHPITRREHSLILCTALMRAAGLDLNEQGDVWAQVVEHRDAYLQASPTDVAGWERFTGEVRSLLLGAPRTTGDWYTAFENAGAALHRQRERGTLTRGLRAVIALHVIFHWNRLGLPATTQATLARAAQKAIFGLPDPPLPEAG
ncbi:thiopeptide-type bacteriocin biosynthesis protein [Plantactinospora siamensis]|uniref:Thiopeptide-type bacteriocin biosynthesis protein n=1 Tax=Plantactinospora siamensis TaxID=555372 RepID=A0ABV6NXZ1_9ACTN